jgi:hypothetical protein
VRSHQIHEDGAFHAFSSHRHSSQGGDFICGFRIERIEHGDDESSIVHSKRNDTEAYGLIGSQGIHGFRMGLDGLFVPGDLKQFAP